MAGAAQPPKHVLPTPPVPDDLPKIEFANENARLVFYKRYVRKNVAGEPAETPEETFWRVAYHVAKAEAEFGASEDEVIARARDFYHLLAERLFFPNSPTWTGAGTPLGQLAACFVLPISDDMGRKDSGIFMTLRNAALIQQTGGGNGFSFSRLRPRNTIVKSSAGKATGPVGFLRVYDKAFGEIAQGGTRRGANMAVLRVDHPDIEDFITCKTDENAITNFNISVGVTDAFMRAVENDEEWELVFPDVLAPEYETFDGTLEDAREQGIPLKVYRKVRARELFDKIVRQAHHNGEPGMLFLDAANRDNPVPQQYRLEATNPCFVGSTRIPTTRGLVPIQELAESGEPFGIVTDNRAPWGGRGMAGTRTETTLRYGVRAFKTRSNAPVYRLRTRHGYSVIATPDHPFLTPDRGYVPLEDLKPGDRILLQSGEGVWSEDYALPNLEALAQGMAEMALAGDWASGHLVQRRDFRAQYAGLPREWSRELGVVLGYLIGDGWLSPTSNSAVGWTFASRDELEQVHAWLRSWFGQGHVAHRGGHYQVTYGRLPYQFFAALGVKAVPATEKRVPEMLWRAPREAVVGFLQGLFSADGSVQIQEAKRDCTVRLASSSRALLEDVQLLLLNFGIVSRIYHRRPAMWRPMPNGRGGQRLYHSQPQYELVIGKVNRDRFARRIGFFDEAKQARLMAFVESQRRGPYRETFETLVESIEPAGTADVYDLTEPQTHSLIANGLVCHNCGEQWLGPYENCCLGSINLAQHATPDGRVDWAKLQRTVERAVRFLDDVVQANAYVPAVPQLKEAAHRNRRIGLGIKGLADLMYRNRVRYGSPEAQDFAAQIMEFIRFHAMRTSIQLAKERGPFPGIKGSIYDPENLTWRPPSWPEWLGGKPQQDLGRPPLPWEEIVEGIRRHGIRNAAQMTVAPTGCLVSGSMVVTDRGVLPIEALGNPRGTQWQDIEMRVASEGGTRPATRFYINGVAHTLRVRTRRGYTLQGTDGHRVRVWENGTLRWKRLDELRPGMKVALMGAGLVGKPRRVSLDNHKATSFHPTEVTLPESMTPELAYLVGLFMGDGSLKSRTLRFSLSNAAHIRHVQRLLQQVFGIQGTIVDDPRSKTLKSLEVHSRNVVEFWKRNGFAKRAPNPQHHGKGYRPHIPLAVLETNDERVYAAFLAGLFDADASVLRHHIVWLTTDEMLHDQVKALLLTLGILTTTDLQTTGLSGRRSYRLRTAHADAARRLWRLIGPYTYRPQPAITVRRPSLRDRIPVTEDEYRRALALTSAPREKQRLWAWRQQGWQASRSTLRAFVEEHRADLAEAQLERWEAVIAQNIFFDEILQVEDGGWQPTYDISVPDTHAYIAQGFISHNTISTVSGVEGYGCEPVFALAYYRYVNDEDGKRIRLRYVSPLFMQALEQTDLDEATRERLIEHVLEYGTLQNFPGELPDWLRHTFVVAQDVSAEEHVRMQAALQVFVDNAISKTINFPATATPDDVAQAFMLAWKLGVKGLTVYVTGSRETVVLETKATAKEKGQAVDEETPPPEPAPADQAAATETATTLAAGPRGAGSTPTLRQEVSAVTQPTLWPEVKKPRPEVLKGFTFQVNTPLGKAFVTINENGGDQPFEVFINTAKAGSETAAISEAIGRLISYILRLSSPVKPIERLEEIIRQLRGIGGDRPLGFGPYRIRSLPDGVGYALEKYLQHYRERMAGPTNGEHAEARASEPLPLLMPPSQGANGDENPQNTGESRVFVQAGHLCPECGQATLIYEEGCAKCYSCGYSEC